jgi:hypothetical protein
MCYASCRQCWSAVRKVDCSNWICVKEEWIDFCSKDKCSKAYFRKLEEVEQEDRDEEDIKNHVRYQRAAFVGSE